MRQILRLEHADGQGIFTSFKPDGDRRDEYDCTRVECHDDVSMRHESFNNPYMEGIRFIEGVHFCAYKSVEQFQKWIYSGEFAEYYRNGIKAYLIEVSEYLEGRDQILYEKQYIVSKKDVSQLFI